MKVIKNVNNIVVILDQAWEQETGDWLWGRYNEHFLTNHLTLLFEEKRKAKIHIEIREQVEKEVGTNN